MADQSYEQEKYQVAPFDINLIKPGHLIAVVGTNTTLAEAIIKEVTAHLAVETKHVRVFSCSTAIDNIATYIPATYIDNHFDVTELKNLYQKQVTNMEWCNDQSCSGETRKVLKTQFSTLLILDQCASDKNTAWFKDTACNEIFQKHASNECTLIYRAVEMDYIPATFKNHFDFCFVVSSSAAEEHSKVFNRFGGYAQTLATLRKAFTYNLMDTSALVIMRAASAPLNIPDDDQGWKKYFARYDPFASPTSTYFRFGPSHLWTSQKSDRTHWKAKPTWESGGELIVGKKSARRGDKMPALQSQYNPTIDEVLKIYGQHKRLRIEVLSDDDDDDHQEEEYEYYSS